MKSVGVCVGASTITYVCTEQIGKQHTVLDTKSIVHEGNPRDVLEKTLEGDTFANIDRLAVTGRRFRRMVRAATISEPEAVERAYRFVDASSPGPGSNLIVSAGGESVMVYRVDSRGRVLDVATGNKCASGTGEFYLQQLKRMDIDLEEAAAFAENSQPFHVSGRCSVFCKSDCTHALNIGIPKGNIVTGLTTMMAGKIAELVRQISLTGGNGTEARVMLVGGSARNAKLVSALRDGIEHVTIPEHAHCFEALGASISAFDRNDAVVNGHRIIISKPKSSFQRHPAIRHHLDMVTYREADRRAATAGERCILGLDVGSTTTKAVLIPADSQNGSAILASTYLRTNGNPVQAARECYSDLIGQLPADIEITGLATTGSGRQISALHALTPSVINEIVAHATAAAHYDPEVDTIFEIGGQDAKYTFLTNGVASDYAMNEACSAGTGSFLEEAARESLSIETEEIAGYAMDAEAPANFSDQCAAFINSDIKSAIQEGIGLEDIAAGVVYSVCMNYANRVKGSRAVGEKIFMQGGVCYNRAVPAAMAALTAKNIVVPPDPGLMGAFGVALNLRRKINLGLATPMQFNLESLAAREVKYSEPFVCRGGKEKCDRKCEINRIVIEEKTFPFGGACDRYYNQLRGKKNFDVGALDMVQYREKAVFDRYADDAAQLHEQASTGKTIGLNRSLLANTFYPLYYHFFTGLGYDIVTTDEVDPDGIDRRGSAFCYPAEISHGTLSSLLKLKPDLIFLPKVKSIHLKNRTHVAVTCPIVHAEASYLKSAFKELQEVPVIEPTLDFAKGYRSQTPHFLDIGRQLGHTRRDSRTAYRAAVKTFEDMLRDFKQAGKAALQDIEDGDEIAIVLFGRPYNAFASLGNKGIPHKFASRGYRVIPCDFLDYEAESVPEHVYWGAGEVILKSARLISRHPKLFGVYITNFSCGPDSFLVDFFRKEMGGKPSLTLELDNHTADVGIDTRIEAFLDVVKSYIELNRNKEKETDAPFTPAKAVLSGSSVRIVDSHGVRHKLTDPRVHFLLPSMMDNCSRAVSAVLRKSGIRADYVPDPTMEEFRLGLGHTSGKECLPIAITAGSLLRYLKTRSNPNELLVYFMPGDSGPCRFGSYYLVLQNIIEKLKVPDVAFLSLSQDEGYAGFGSATSLRIWQVVIITDVLEEIYASLLVLSEDTEEALRVYKNAFDRIVHSLEFESWKGVENSLKHCASELAKVRRKGELDDFPTVGLINEMYVRRNNFARKNIVERLAARGINVRVAGLHEWIYYVDHVVKKRLVQFATLSNRLRTHIETPFKRHYEKKIKRILAESGLCQYRIVDVEKVVGNAEHLVPKTLICESILITGTAITDLIEDVSGIISIQPFGCMPGRVGEAIISRTLHDAKRESADEPDLVESVMKDFPFLPFLTLEVDGQVFTQGIEAKLDSFCLQVSRLHAKTRSVRAGT